VGGRLDVGLGRRTTTRRVEMNVLSSRRRHVRRFMLSLNKCARGHGTQMIALDSRDEKTGDGSGTRLTNVKCCGSWETVDTWRLSTTNLREIAETYSDAASEMDDAGV